MTLPLLPRALKLKYAVREMVHSVRCLFLPEPVRELLIEQAEIIAELAHEIQVLRDGKKQ